MKRKILFLIKNLKQGWNEVNGFSYTPFHPMTDLFKTKRGF